MDYRTLVILIGLGLLCLCFLMPVAEAVVKRLRDRIAQTVPALAGLAQQAFTWAGRLLTEDGTLSLVETIAQVGGAVLLMAAGLVFVATDLAITLATLMPLLGMGSGKFDMFHNLLGISLVALAVVFGLMLSDLLGWSMVSRFAFITRARPGAFCLGVVCFLSSLLVTLALAAYRIVVMLTESGSEAAAATLMGLHALPALILLGLAALLFIGLGICLLHTEVFCRTLVALVIAVGGVVCVSLRLLLGGIDLLLDILVTGMQATPNAFSRLTNAGQAGMGRVRERLATASGGFFTKIGQLVQQRAPRGQPASHP